MHAQRLVQLGLLGVICCGGYPGGPAAKAAEPIPPATVAPPGRALPDVVHDYVDLGLASNLTLNNAGLEVERSLDALSVPRAHYLPELSLVARYTRADGGRQIVFPAGELFNPVYTSLNELLAASGGAQRFGTRATIRSRCELPREQDTHLSLRQPIYSPAIVAGAHAAEAAAGACPAPPRVRPMDARSNGYHAGVSALWLRAGKASAIVGSSLGLLQENLRVNESLFNSGKTTRDQVLRARAEWLDVKQQQTTARDAVQQAQSYLNFLLNRPLTTPIEESHLPDTLPVAAPSPTEEQRSQALATRPEMEQLDATRRAAAAQVQSARAGYKPTLALGVDFGSEGTNYGYGPHYNYTTASLLFNWSLFNGGATRAQLDAAHAAEREVANQRELAAHQIELEVQQSHDATVTAIEALNSATARAEAARAAFRIASRRRDEGAATQLEFLDARNELTGAELNLNLSQFELLRQRAQLAYATGAP